MKRNNKGFTLIELLAVIVVLAVVMVLATTTVLPYMSGAREDAFRIEATSAVKSAEEAYSLYSIGQIKVDNDNNSCVSKTKACFTISSLVDNGVYTGDKDTFSGKVDIDLTNNTYTLSFKKNDEFRIKGTYKDFTKNGELTMNWDKETDEVCSCN